MQTASRTRPHPESWVPYELSDFYIRTPIGQAFKEGTRDNIEPNCFGNHSWYFNIMTRGTFRLFEKPGAFHASISPSWADGMNGEWAGSLTVLRPQVHSTAYFDFAKFLRNISVRRKKPILLKQVPIECEEGLIEAGCRQYHSNEAWSIRYRYDEQENPEVVLTLTDLCEDDAKALTSSLSKQARRAYNFFTICEIGPERIELVRGELTDLFMKWRDNFRRRYPSLVTTYEFVGWNLAAVEAISLNKDERLFLARNVDNTKLVGFFFLTRSTPYQWDMAMSFCDGVVNDLHRMLYIKVIRLLADEGVAFINMGGSEEASLYRAKKRICNSIEIGHTHLVMDARKTNAD